METPADARLANVAGAVVLGMADEIRRATERATGLSGAGPAALVLLSQSLRGASMDALRRAVGLTPSGTVRLVDRLVADGLVERRAGTDQRSLALVLTRSGRASARRALAARADAVAASLGGLTDADRAALVPLVEKLAGAVTVERVAARAHGDPPDTGWLCRLCDQLACGRPVGQCPAATAATSS